MVVQGGQTPTYAEPLPVDEAASAERLDQRPRRRGPQWCRILWENRKSRLGLLLLAFFALVAVFSPVIAPHDPDATTFASNLDPSREHLLGTTTLGQDIFSRLVEGTRTSMVVGLLGGTLATLIALLVGLTAGYLGGLVDDVLSFFINIALVIPTLPLIAVIASYSQVQGVVVIIVVIGITGWAYGARIKRAQMVTLRERDYITAAVFAGEGVGRIIFREIMPNMTSLVVAGYIGAAGGAIGAEAGLSFLGLSDPTVVSWGKLSGDANDYGALLTGQWPWLVAPGLALALLITALTLVNFGVDALSNPHLREE